MAQLWAHQDNAEAEWTCASLDEVGDALGLTGEPARPVAAVGDAQWPATLVRRTGTGAGSQDEWFLFAAGRTRVWVNGDGLDLGVRALNDKDEIRVNGVTVWFSKDRQAGIAPFPGIGRRCVCPRCKTEIPLGSPAVQCPGCSTYHHQNPSEEKPCWTYAEGCSVCGRPTSLEDGCVWTPEDL